MLIKYFSEPKGTSLNDLLYPNNIVQNQKTQGSTSKWLIGYYTYDVFSLTLIKLKLFSIISFIGS